MQSIFNICLTVHVAPSERFIRHLCHIKLCQKRRDKTFVSATLYINIHTVKDYYYRLTHCTFKRGTCVYRMENKIQFHCHCHLIVT